MQWICIKVCQDLKLWKSFKNLSYTTISVETTKIVVSNRDRYGWHGVLLYLRDHIFLCWPTLATSSMEPEIQPKNLESPTNRILKVYPILTYTNMHSMCIYVCIYICMYIYTHGFVGLKRVPPFHPMVSPKVSEDRHFNAWCLNPNRMAGETSMFEGFFTPVVGHVHIQLINDYPLVNIKKTIENGHWNSGFTH